MKSKQEILKAKILNDLLVLNIYKENMENQKKELSLVHENSLVRKKIILLNLKKILVKWVEKIQKLLKNVQLLLKILLNKIKKIINNRTTLLCIIIISMFLASTKKAYGVENIEEIKNITNLNKENIPNLFLYALLEQVHQKHILENKSLDLKKEMENVTKLIQITNGKRLWMTGSTLKRSLLIAESSSALTIPVLSTLLVHPAIKNDVESRFMIHLLIGLLNGISLISNRAQRLVK